MKCEITWSSEDKIDNIIENITAIAANTDMKIQHYHVVFVTGSD